jgi:hypothetical protein
MASARGFYEAFGASPFVPAKAETQFLAKTGFPLSPE